MCQVNAGDIQRLIAEMIRSGYEPKTVRNLWGTVSLIWQAALAQRYVDAVLPKPKLPKLVRKKPRLFTLVEVARIIHHSPQKCLYWLLAEAGLRAGEIAGLRVQDVGLNCLPNKNASILRKWKLFRFMAAIGCGGWI
jgi:integrase